MPLLIISHILGDMVLDYSTAILIYFLLVVTTMLQNILIIHRYLNLRNTSANSFR